MKYILIFALIILLMSACANSGETFETANATDTSASTTALTQMNTQSEEKSASDKALINSDYKYFDKINLEKTESDKLMTDPKIYKAIFLEYEFEDYVVQILCDDLCSDSDEYFYADLWLHLYQDGVLLGKIPAYFSASGATQVGYKLYRDQDYFEFYTFEQNGIAYPLIMSKYSDNSDAGHFETTFYSVLDGMLVLFDNESDNGIMVARTLSSDYQVDAQNSVISDSKNTYNFDFSNRKIIIS